MALTETVKIGKARITFRASALVPRLYRAKFGRDMIADMNILRKSYNKAANLPENATEEERQDAQLSVLDLTIFENVAYIMAKHANKNVPSDPDAWLDSIPGVFSIYEIMPVLLRLWGDNTKTTSIPAKK